MPSRRTNESQSGDINPTIKERFIIATLQLTPALKLPLF